METYTRLNQFPKTYFQDFPCNKRTSLKILNKNKKNKRNFKSDDELKTYIINKWCEEQLEIINKLSEKDENLKKIITFIFSQLE